MGKSALAVTAKLEFLAAEDRREAASADRDADRPFAYVEQGIDGPRLIVGSVCVRWWTAGAQAAEAWDMAQQINEDLAIRIRGERP